MYINILTILSSNMENFKINFTYNNLLNNISNSVNFSFSRFGDGEWNCIFNKKGHNCDGHEYFTDLGLELKKIVEGIPEYIVGLQSLGYSIWKDDIDKLTNINFSDSDILHRASINGVLDLFLNNKRINYKKMDLSHNNVHKHINYIIE